MYPKGRGGKGPTSKGRVGREGTVERGDGRREEGRGGEVRGGEGKKKKRLRTASPPLGQCIQAGYLVSPACMVTKLLLTTKKVTTKGKKGQGKEVMGGVREVIRGKGEEGN